MRLRTSAEFITIAKKRVGACRIVETRAGGTGTSAVDTIFTLISDTVLTARPHFTINDGETVERGFDERAGSHIGRGKSDAELIRFRHGARDPVQLHGPAALHFRIRIIHRGADDLES